jgi:predicted branched-subunit amino acid permease
MNGTFTKAGLQRGFLAAQPLALGIFVYGIAFGLLCIEARITLAESMTMSAVVYSGSAQVVAIQSVQSGQPPVGAALLGVLGTILLLNARYLLYGASIRPWLAQSPPHLAYPTLLMLGDGNYVLSMKRRLEGETDAGFILGSGLATFVPWVGGTAIGLTGTTYLVDPSKLALDFLLVAFSAAMGASMAKSKGDLPMVVTACLVSIALSQLSPGIAIFGAAVAACCVAAWLSTRVSAPATTEEKAAS